MIEHKTIAKLGWSLPLSIVIITSTIHLLTGHYRDVPFFISEADYPGVERFVFKIGFFVNGLILMYLSCLLFQVCKPRARWYWMHLSCISGVIVGINLSLMAMWDIYDHERLHVFTATNVFYFGIIWGIVTHLALHDASQTSKNLRYVSISCSILAFLGMVYSISLGLEKYPEYVDGNWDLDKMQPWINWAAPLEYLMVFSFILTLKSFEEELLSANE